MKVSFDGLRKNLAQAYMDTVNGYREAVKENGYDDSFAMLKSGLDDMRQMVAALLCCYDTESINQDKDFHDLSELADGLPFAGHENIEDETDNVPGYAARHKPC